jgi:cobalt-zinc-cadmium resistance protein CzcA
MTVLAALTLFAGSCVLATRLGGEFLPKLSEGSIVITPRSCPASISTPRLPR